MPAHVTLLFPFAPVEEVDLAAVTAATAEAESFAFSLGPAREWEDGVIWLEPNPSDPFVRLTEQLVERFPDYPPYGGVHDEVVPHLTVVHTDDVAARADARASVTGSLPIRCDAKEFWLMHEVNGRWRGHTRFPLGR
jgi:2'-5' RNA ligase